MAACEALDLAEKLRRIVVLDGRQVTSLAIGLWLLGRAERDEGAAAHELAYRLLGAEVAPAEVGGE
jgi:hypothetical protein